MIKLQEEKTACHYCISMDKCFMLQILLKEDRNDQPLYYYVIGVEGVIECNYNGHFGPNVYVEIDNSFDTPATMEKIKQAISDYVEGKYDTVH